MENNTLKSDPMRDQIYLAALLHDIGKFHQRADTGSVRTSIILKDEVKKLEQYFCPQFKGNSTHKHVLWTAQFIIKFENVFKNLYPEEFLKLINNNQSLLHLASGHHLSPEQLSAEGRLIREADHLSSGMDRTNDESFKDDQDEIAWDSFKTKRMVSIFENILKDSHMHSFHLPVEELNLNESLLPVESFSSPPGYGNLWRGFVSEFKFLQQNRSKEFSESLLGLLYKYTCTVPSSTINFPDVSLFDHLKTTAAIAVCLYDWNKEEKHADDAGKDPFLMIGADFSGIQNYIYNIISKSAARNLKGRSFYLKLLSDSIVKIILDGLSLFDANVIYNAGGGFFILASNTAQTRSKLENLSKLIEEKIFYAHGTAIYVAIESVSLSKDTLLGKQGNPSIGEKWNELFEKRDNLKKRRYQDKLVRNYELFFEPGEAGGTNLRDAITGEELDFTGNNIYSIDGKKIIKEPAGQDVIGELTYRQIILGRKLKHTEIIVESDHILSYWPDSEFINPANLGVFFYFLSQGDLDSKAEQLKLSADSVRIITVNSNKAGKCEFINPLLQGSNNIYGFEFIGGNDFPADENGDPLYFDELTGEDGLRRLGVLRMDVDNLGNIFRNGIKSNHSTFSRYAALSRNLDWFFKGYLNTLWKKEYSDSAYIVYSGGDDLFIVGKWNQCISFAERIKDHFEIFTCRNENIGISGGLAIVTPKFPIKKAAEESARAENSAKSFNNGSKNALSFLGYPMGWRNEYAIIKTLKNRILTLLTSGRLPKSFITKINSHFSGTIDSTIKAGKFTISPRLYWLMAYDFGRFEQRYKKDKEVSEIIVECKNDIYSNTISKEKNKAFYHAFELWVIASRWAELEYRTKK